VHHPQLAHRAKAIQNTLVVLLLLPTCALRHSCWRCLWLPRTAARHYIVGHATPVAPSSSRLHLMVFIWHYHMLQLLLLPVTRP
jgi:hypothetical protein